MRTNCPLQIMQTNNTNYPKLCYMNKCDSHTFQGLIGPLGWLLLDGDLRKSTGVGTHRERGGLRMPGQWRMHLILKLNKRENLEQDKI